jgi:hypothetical protein
MVLDYPGKLTVITIIFLFWWNWVELRANVLARQALYSLSHISKSHKHP